MELYTINKADLRRDELIDGFESVIWTERFIEAGDFNIVVPATSETVRLLRPGNLLGLSTSRELQIVDTRTVKDGVITATGKTVETFLNNRRNGKLTLLTWPGHILGEIIDDMQARSDGEWEIPQIRNGSLDETDPFVFERVPAGKVHDTLLAIAKKHKIGMALYWTAREDDAGYDLVFTTRALRDRTLVDGPDPPQIIFSPDLDNLADVSEVLTNVDAVNAVVVHPPKHTDALDAILDGIDPLYKPTGFTMENFDLRLAEVRMDFISKPSQLEGDTTEEKQDTLREMMKTKAKEALKLKRHVIDGEFTPAAQYKYYTDQNLEGLPEYRLGDIVQVRGNFASPTKSVLSEYIHSSDSTGTRSYPGFVTLDSLDDEEGS